MEKIDSIYLSLVKEIQENGYLKNTRSGLVKSIFGYQFKISLSDGLPLLTTKKMFYKGILIELIWFLRGDTNIKYLIDNNVNIWNDDAYRWYLTLINKHNNLCKIHNQNNLIIELLNKDIFLEKVKNNEYIRIANNEDFFDETCNSLNEAIIYKYGDLGDVYGKQWRKYGISSRDQVQEIIDKLKTNPDDRRLLCIAYNPDTLDKIALPPCHIMFQFYTRELNEYERLNILKTKYQISIDNLSEEKLKILLDKYNVEKRELSLLWYQRSVDVGLGLPFNIASYSMLTYIIANIVHMIPGNVIASLGDCHIYENHNDGLNKQLLNNPNKFDLPKFVIKKQINDINNITFNDFSVENYESFETIKLPLSVG